MKKIKGIELYVGVKEEYNDAIQHEMKIVCALNRVNGYVCHQSVVGWTGRGCNEDNPYYLFKLETDAIYLNMIDGKDPKYVNDKMINPALEFIHQKLQAGNKVFVYCSLGKSRSPSIALMYMLEYGLIERDSNALSVFKKDYYPNYYPKTGNSMYIKNRWGI